MLVGQRLVMMMQMNAGGQALVTKSSTSAAPYHNLAYNPIALSPLPKPEGMFDGLRGILPRTAPPTQAPPPFQTHAGGSTTTNRADPYAPYNVLLDQMMSTFTPTITAYIANRCTNRRRKLKVPYYYQGLPYLGQSVPFLPKWRCQDEWVNIILVCIPTLKLGP